MANHSLQGLLYLQLQNTGFRWKAGLASLQSSMRPESSSSGKSSPAPAYGRFAGCFGSTPCKVPANSKTRYRKTAEPEKHRDERTFE